MGPLMQMFRQGFSTPQGQMGYQMPQRHMASPDMAMPMPVKPVGMYDAPSPQRQRIVGPGGAPPPMTTPPQPGGLAAMLANSRRPVSTRVRPVDPAMPIGGMGGPLPGVR